MVGESFIQKKRMSANIFALANGHPTLTTNLSMLEQRVRDPARKINMVSALANQSLLNGGKNAEAGYVSV